MLTDILLTAVEVCAFFGGIYLIIIYLWIDLERKKLDKSCPHCKLPSPRVNAFFSRLKQVTVGLK